MPLKLLGSTSGYTQIDAASVAANNTITLPSTSGTIVVTNGAQTLEFADGSASTPSITNSGDTNTGIFFPEADGVAISTGGSERFRFGPAGELGVGGATYGTAGQALKSSGSGAAPAWGNVSSVYSQSGEPTSASDGDVWYNTGNNNLYMYAGSAWTLISDTNVVSNINKGLFGGAATSVYSSAIYYVNISSVGNASSFGSLTVARGGTGSLSSSSRALWGGGIGDSGASNVIDYVSISIASNAFDFGDLTTSRAYPSGCSNGTRGLFGGGSNVIDYVTISTTSNAADFGDLTLSVGGRGSCAGGDRGVWMGGSGGWGTIDYVSISTTGNAAYFGDLTVARGVLSSCSNGSRGVAASGQSADGTSLYNTIDYITIATTGNAVDFGDLTLARTGTGSCSNGTRGIWGGGRIGSSVWSNVVDYITISTAGNAADFGDLLAQQSVNSACSGFYGAV